MSISQYSREAIERENLSRLQSALRVARETEQIGAETCAELQMQTEQIHRIADKTQNVDHNLQQSKRIVRGMSGFMGRVKNWFSKAPKEPESIRQTVSASRKSKEESKEKLAISDPKAPKTEPLSVQQAEDTKKAGIDAYYTQEEEQFLDEIEKHVMNIKDMAYNIGDTLDYHNEVLDLITVQTDKNTRDMHTIERKMRRLM